MKEKPFSGNIAFCSKYAMLQLTRSRRDDMTAVVYLLLYLYKGNLSYLGIDQDKDSPEAIGNAKHMTNAE